MNTPSQPNRESIREEMDKLRYPDRSIVNAPVDSTPSMMLSDWVWKKIDQALAEQRESIVKILQTKALESGYVKGRKNHSQLVRGYCQGVSDSAEIIASITEPKE